MSGQESNHLYKSHVSLENKLLELTKLDKVEWVRYRDSTDFMVCYVKLAPKDIVLLLLTYEGDGWNNRPYFLSKLTSGEDGLNYWADRIKVDPVLWDIAEKQIARRKVRELDWRVTHERLARAEGFLKQLESL